jgi:hypothetical protein
VRTKTVTGFYRDCKVYCEDKKSYWVVESVRVIVRTQRVTGLFRDCNFYCENTNS